MKKVLQFSIMILALLLCFEADLYGQKRGKKKKSSKTDEYFDESGGFKHRLWYGGSFNLGFANNGFTSEFNLGVSPMVGYKVFEKLSVGPRLSLDYSFIKIRFTQNDIRNVQPVSYSFGAFARYKVFANLFLHTEYELQNEGRITNDQNNINFDNNGDILVRREIRDNYYIGAGYNSGGQFGYEIYLLYNLLEPENSPTIPISIRFGFTYGF